MILIVHDSLEAAHQLNGLNVKWSENKAIHKRLIEAYNSNFEIWLKTINKFSFYKKLSEGSKYRYHESPNPDRIQVEKLMDEYDYFRPYYYTLGGRYYFLRSRLRDLHEANIFELESEEILKSLENMIEGLGLIATMRRRRSHVDYVVALD